MGKIRYLNFKSSFSNLSTQTSSKDMIFRHNINKIKDFLLKALSSLRTPPRGYADKSARFGSN